MPFNATINIGSDDFEVLHVDMDFIIPIDLNTNRPKAKAQPGLINLTIISGNDNILPLEVYNWCINHQTKNGTIVFYRSDNAAALKTLQFSNAYCVKYKEVFDADGREPMKIYISISPMSITMYDSSTSFTNGWNSESSKQEQTAPAGSRDGSVSTFDAS